MAVSSYLSESLTLSGGSGPLPGPIARHSTRHSGLWHCWLAGPALSPTSQPFVLHHDPHICLSLALSVFPLWYVSLHLSGLFHLSFPVSVSPSRLRNAFLSHLQLCLSLSSSCLSLSLSLPIFASPPSLSLSVSARLSGSGWVQDSPARAPRRTMPHSRGPSAPWQRARPALPVRGPRAPRGCHGYVRRVPAPRAAAPRALGGARPAGGAGPQPLQGQEGRPPRGLQPLSASVSPSVHCQGSVE